MTDSNAAMRSFVYATPGDAIEDFEAIWPSKAYASGQHFMTTRETPAPRHAQKPRD